MPAVNEVWDENTRSYVQAPEFMVGLPTRLKSGLFAAGIDEVALREHLASHEGQTLLMKLPNIGPKSLNDLIAWAETGTSTPEIEVVTQYKASDGSLHWSRKAAQEHIRRSEFREWCNKELRGGTYSPSMFADAVLESWNVTRRKAE
jgi:hypothetical protein